MKNQTDHFLTKQGITIHRSKVDQGFTGVVAAANTVWHRDDEMKPGNLF